MQEGTPSASGPILAICRDPAAFHSVLAGRRKSDEDIVIASDDLDVHALARNCPGLKIVYFDQMESLFDVAPQVLKLLGAVNKWLRAQGDEICVPADLLYWVQHVEGGVTTQRILEAVLEVRSCAAIFDRIKPSKLTIGASSRRYWEDTVLVACATQRKIPVHAIKSVNPGRGFSGLWQQLRPFAVAFHQSLLTIDSLLRRKASGFGGAKFGPYVAIQMCTSGVGHFNNTLPLVKAFARVGLEAIVVTFSARRTALAIRAQGYKVVELESWVPPRALFQSWWAAFRVLQRAKANRGAFLSGNEEVQYASLIRVVLLSSVRSFLIAEFPQLLRLDAACKALFSKNPPIAARLWTNILQPGVISFRAMKAVGVRPLLFRQIGLDILPNPYFHHDAAVDLFFCVSDAGRERLRAEGQTASQIAVAGITLRPRVEEFASQNTVEHSRRLLRIDPLARLVIFCDAQDPTRGYSTAMEQAWLVQAMIEFAEQHEDVSVILKPHPGYRGGHLEAMLGGRGSGRITWIPGNALPYHGLNAAHVVLTKMSTVTIEAMLLGVPSICVLLDQDLRWAIYEDAVDYALSVEDLGKKLNGLRNTEEYSSWADTLRQRQLPFMERHFPKPSGDVFALVAREVKNALTSAK